MGRHGGVENEENKKNEEAVLVIKHGALGDIFQAFPVFSALRRAFPRARLALLTGSAHAELVRRGPWFDEVLTDDRAPFWQARPILRVRRLFGRFSRIYDFQNSNRTRLYQKLSRLTPHPPLWCSAAAGSHWRHGNPARQQMHTLRRQDDQLRCAGLTPTPREVPRWLCAPVSVLDLALDAPYVVLVPAAAPHRPAKRWPLAHYAALLPFFHARGLRVVVVGAPQDAPVGETLAAIGREKNINVLNRVGRTTLPELAGLMSRAVLTVGNDTGPMHVAASMDTPTLTLFSTESDPRRTAPLSVTPGRSRVLSVADLSRDLSPERVIDFLAAWLTDRNVFTEASSRTFPPATSHKEDAALRGGVAGK